MKLTEQNDRHEKSSVKVDNKRRANRAIRHAAKRDPENAPTKIKFRGYTG